MGKYIFGLMAIAILALTALYAFDPSYQQRRSDAAYFAAEAQRVQVAASATSTALTMQREQATAPISTGLTIWSYILMGLAMGAAVVLTAGFCVVFLAKRALLVQPNTQGIVPIPLVGFDRLAQQSGATLGLFHGTQMQRAIHQPGQTPQSLTFSPQYRNEQRGLPEQLAPYALPLNDALAGVPTFAQLLDSGRIGAGRPMIVGFDTEGQAVELSFKSLFSAGVGGLQGSGKTWSTVNIVAQSVLSGARLVICDLHAGDEESLATRLEPLSGALLFGVADTPKSITTAVQNVDAILTKRKEGDKDRSLIILAFDEYTSTLRRLGKDGDAMSDMIANLTSEGRKFGIFCLLLAQNWGAESTGGSEVRNTLASALIHRIRPAEARMLTGMTADSLPKDTLQLAPGEFYLLDTHGDMTKVAAPRITAADVVRVAGLLTDDQPTTNRLTQQPEIAIDQPLISQLLSQDVVRSQSNGRSDYSASQRSTALSPDEARIVALFLGGKDASQIVTEITGGWTSKKGSPYMSKLTEVQATIRKALAAGAA